MGRTVRTLLAGLIAGSGALVATAPPAAAACASPQLLAEPTTVVPGGTVTLRGYGFITNCPDTIPYGGGEPEPWEPPPAGIAIVFFQPGLERTLGTVDADAGYDFATTVTVPVDARFGEALLVARLGYDIVTRVTVAAPARPAGTLPRTGAAAPALLAALGLLLVLAGTGLARVRLRTRR